MCLVIGMHNVQTFLHRCTALQFLDAQNWDAQCTFCIDAEWYRVMQSDADALNWREVLPGIVQSVEREKLRPKSASITPNLQTPKKEIKYKNELKMR